MTWYEFLLFAHIAMAAIWVGGGAMLQFFGLRAINAPDPMRLAQLGQDIEWVGSRVLVPASALAVVSGILGLGHGMGLVVVAEGVEQEEHLAVLRDMGCDEYQGFIDGRPGRLPDVLANPQPATTVDVRDVAQRIGHPA